MAKVFFHNDLDGRCSAAIVYNFYDKSANYIEVDYKDKIDVDAIKPNEEIIIVDFSFNSVNHKHSNSLEPMIRLELMTSSLPRTCSTN